ncbi:MAG: tetratricopeptide repeat protein [Elusimicrobia bacterium]|nr:tetratricopeptide repeat protein [Elusimicrobiota bacterium]
MPRETLKQPLFAEIEPLVRTGRLKEAAAVLKKMVAAGLPSWELHLWMARISERGSRFSEAEDMFRKAMKGGAPGGAVEVEYGRLLENLGRFDEAVSMLQAGLASGGGAVGYLLALGRLHEKMGRPDQAEAHFKEARRADPSSVLPCFELARLLDSMGRIDESRAGLKECADRLKAEMAGLARGFLKGGGAGESKFFDLMEIPMCREAFLAEVLKAPDEARRAEAALRNVLRADSGAAGGRTLLAELLIARKKFAEAARETALAFSPASRGSPASRSSPVLKLVEAGSYGPGLEEAVLSCVRRAGAADSSQADWYQVFSALLCRGEYRAAFRLGEALVDKPEPLAASHALLWPWWRKVRRSVGEDKFCAEELKRMAAAARGGGFPHWFAYCRTILLSIMSRFDEASAEYRHIRDLDPVRYSWMRQPFVLLHLHTEQPDFDAVIAVSRIVLEWSPGHWWVRCRMAEAHLAKGELKKGLADLQRAEDGAAGSAQGEVLTWHGEVLLWLGRYREAFEKLDAAVRLGDKTFVFGWRGGASLKLGDLKDALADLDRAIELDAKDMEAYVWRGEALRLLGRPGDALKDLDHFIGQNSRCLWGYFNRGLAKDALGDGAGMMADFACAVRVKELAPQIEFIGKTLGGASANALSRSLDRAGTHAFMKKGLELAKGVRRWELYVQSIWMRYP